ncbi:MAG: hypothetical protein ABIH46_06630 [Chloroflexota bacterium]
MEKKNKLDVVFTSVGTGSGITAARMTCPKCKARVSISLDMLDHEMPCPACGQTVKWEKSGAR